MNTLKNGFILNEDSINFQQLKIFFTKLEELEIPNLKKQFNITDNIKDIYSFPIKSFVRKKESSFNIKRIKKQTADSFKYLDSCLSKSSNFLK